MEVLFEEALALCLDRVADGDSPASCAESFPEFTALLPLLQIAAELIAPGRAEAESGRLIMLHDRPSGTVRGVGAAGE